jgi:hypothetical protein
MVPQHKDPSGERRPLSPEVQTQLEDALRAFAKNEAASRDMLGAALAKAAADAKQQGLRPEDLVIALRTTEERIPELTQREDWVRSDARVRMIRALLDAYYR